MTNKKGSILQIGAVFAAVALGAALIGNLAYKNALAHQEETQALMALEALDPNTPITVAAGEVFCKDARVVARTHGMNPGHSAEIVQSSEILSIDHDGRTVRIDCSQYAPG